MNSRKIYWLFGFWLLIGVFCSDVTNFGSVRIGINIRPDRILYCIFLYSAYRVLSASGHWLPFNREEKLMVFLFVTCLLSCIIGGAINNPRNRYISNVFNFAFIPVTLFLIARRASFSHESAASQFRFFQILGCYLGVTGILEHYDINALIFPQCITDPSVGYHYGRSRGPFLQAVAMGGAANLIFFWVLWYHRFIRKSLLNIPILLTCLATTYFTDTRSVWLQFAGITLIIVAFSKQLRKPAVAVCMLLVVIYFSGIASKFSPYQATLFSRRDQQVHDRINIAYASLRMFAERPAFGFGYGNFADRSEPYFKEIQGVELRGQGEGQHHTILGLLSDVGLVGTIPFVMIYYLLAMNCYRKLRRATGTSIPERELLTTQLAVLGGSAILMQFGDIRDFSFINNVVFWMAGVTYSCRNLGTRSSAQPDPPPAIQGDGYAARAEVQPAPAVVC